MIAERILGLDIGDQYIKAVVANRTTRGSTQVDYCTCWERTGPGDPTDDIKVFFEKNESLRHLPCITCLSVRDISFRNLSFPFRDDRKIRQTMVFEVEPLLPYPVSEAYLDYVPAKVTDKTEILIAAVSKEVIRGHLDLLKHYVQDTRIIDVEGVSLLPFVLSRHHPSGFDIILDIGAKHTVALFTRERHLFQIREYPFGTKHAGERPSGERQDNGAVDDVYRNFCQDLANTIELLKWQGFSGEDPPRIHLTGGGAGMQEIHQVLAQHFSATIGLLDMAGVDGITFTEAAKRQWEPLLMNNAMSLALRTLRKGEGFDFRAQEKRERPGYAPLKKNIRFISIIAGLMLFFLGADAFLGEYEKRVQLRQLKNKINSIFRQYNPDVKKIVDPVAQMRGKIMETKKAALGLTEALTGPLVLDTLKKLSGSIPPTMEVLFTNFKMDRDSVIIKGEAKNFDTVEAMKKELIKSNNFKSVAIGATTLMKQGDKVEFDMRITLK